MGDEACVFSQQMAGLLNRKAVHRLSFVQRSQHSAAVEAFRLPMSKPLILTPGWSASGQDNDMAPALCAGSRAASTARIGPGMAAGLFSCAFSLHCGT